MSGGHGFLENGHWWGERKGVRKVFYCIEHRASYAVPRGSVPWNQVSTSSGIGIGIGIGIKYTIIIIIIESIIESIIERLLAGAFLSQCNLMYRTSGSLNAFHISNCKTQIN